MNPITALGAMVLSISQQAGGITLFFLSFWRHLFSWPYYFRVFFNQCEVVGVNSIPIVLLTAFFTGGVLALQTYNGFDSSALANTQIGKLVALSMLRELGPVLASLMVAGRVGAAIAAEIGTMRVTEQIDALTTLATNPMKYLVVPRIMACALMVPMLVTLANVLGIFGGYMVSTKVLGIPAHQYTASAFNAIQMDDITLGLVKATVFGLVIGLMGTYHGYNTKGGAAGVGKATTVAVVYASVTILISDYFITAWFV